MFRISPDSPLKLLPEELSERQIIILDGIRYSANMAGIALDRLWAVLQKIDQDFDHADWSDTSEAAMFAWSIVDSAHRIRQLIAGLPGLRQRGWPTDFWTETKDVEDLRHAWQHQISEAPSAVARRDQAFGALAWAQHTDRKPTGSWFCVVAGSDFKGSAWTYAGPINAVPGVGSRRIRLIYDGDKPFYLGRVVRQIFGAIKQLEWELNEGNVRLVGERVNQRRGQDLMLQTTIQVVVTQSD